MKSTLMCLLASLLLALCLTACGGGQTTGGSTDGGSVTDGNTAGSGSVDGGSAGTGSVNGGSASGDAGSSVNGGSASGDTGSSVNGGSVSGDGLMDDARDAVDDAGRAVRNAADDMF